MLRQLICIGLAACAASLSAETVLQQHGDRSTPRITDEQPVMPDDNNWFRKINDAESQRSIKIQGTKKAPASPDDIINNIEQRGVRQPGTPAAAAICPICKQKLARHADPGFRCRPVNDQGELLPFPEIVWTKVHCPCCGVDFKAAMPGKTNNKDGADRDFCEHSVGKTVVHSKVWTCPDCGYAALVDSFGLSWDKTPISEETKAFVQKEIRPVMFMRMCKLAGLKEDAINKADPHGLRDFAKYQEDEWLQAQDMISDWIKYDNAIKIYKHQNAPSSLMAFLYLESAYACRRELNSEVAVSGLILEIEERLGLSIRRINHDINAASIQIRRNRNEASLTDPNKMETDPAVLVDAAELILEMGELDGHRFEEEARRNGEDLDPAKFYSSGDMFVLCIRYAGFLDRLGHVDQAARQLEKAKTFIANPDADHLEIGREQKDFGDFNHLRDFVNKQLQHLRDFVDGRAACLRFENECINRAMWENIVALHQKGVHFADPGNLLAPQDKGTLEPAISAYMIGELARRCDEPLAAPAFLAAADTLYVKQLAELKKEEDALAANKDQPEAKAALLRAKQLRQSWTIMQLRSTEQLTLALQPRKNGAVPEKLNEEFKQVLDKLLQAGGLDAAAFKIPTPVTPKTPPAKTDAGAATTAVKAAAPAAVQAAPKFESLVSSGSIKTRDELYKMYYTAIVRYVKEKKTNPPSLTALVEGNYVPREDACLTEKGNLICPETREALQYYPKFDLGDPNNLVIFQTVKPKDGKSLFADGKIGTFAQRK